MNSKLDVLNLIIETNPSGYNLTKISKKIKEINPLYSSPSATTNNTANSFPSLLNKKTGEVYYKYNILYGSNTNNIIRTYSPKMRPMSASVTSFTKNMHINEYEKCVFSDDEIEQLTYAKCKDLNIDFREKMVMKFKEYCKTRCNNRHVDFSECNIGIYCTKILSVILLHSDRIARLNLSKNNIGDKGLMLICDSIQYSTSLICLNVTSNSITPKGGDYLLKSLVNQKSLIEINVSSLEGINRNRISYEGLSRMEMVLKRNVFIECLHIAGNSIKNKGLRLIINGLNENTTLTLLDISHNDIDSNGFIVNMDHLKSTKILDLNMSNNPIQNEGVIKFTDCLKSFPNIKKLNLSNCKIAFKGLYYLLLNLQNVKRIDTLNISNNDISSDNFEDLKPFFVVFGLKYLNMSKCSLKDYSAYVLGECLILNESIKHVNISDNKISDKGFKSYIHLFSKNSTIEYFDVSKNSISDISARECINNIRYNRSLRNINFYDNQLQNESGTALAELLVHNKTLRHVNVGFNRIQVKCIEEINRRLKANALKQKERYLPNLVKEIESLRIDPEEFLFLEHKINEENRNYESLQVKLKEDNEQYPAMKVKEKEYVEKYLIEKKEGEVQLAEAEDALKKVLTDIKVQQNSFIRQNKDLREAIEYLKEQIVIKKKQYDDKFSEQNKEKRHYEIELEQVRNTLKLFQEKTALAELSLQSLKNDLSRKQSQYESLSRSPNLIKKSITTKGRSPKSTLNSVGASTTNLKRISSKVINHK